MTSEEIQRFLDTKTSADNNYVRIKFKDRESIFGLFVKNHNDYAHLKSKNFWRIVPRSQFDAYDISKNAGLAKIFNGASFSRLAVFTDSFD
jgi:hypothetical protein